MIALCTVLCGGQTAVDMAEFAEDKEEFLRGFLTLKHGLPSHDTFSRVFRLLEHYPTKLDRQNRDSQRETDERSCFQA